MEGPDNKTKQPLSATAKNPLSTPAPASDKVPAPSPAPTSTPAPTPASAQASQPAPSAQPETIKSEPVKPALKPETKAPEEKKHDFHSSDIGKWHARQADPFAAQNAARAEKQAKRASAQKKLLPLLIAACALVIAVIVVIIVATREPAPAPEPPIAIAGNSMEDIAEYQDNLKTLLRKYSAKNPDSSSADIAAALNEAVNKTLATDAGQANSSAVLLAELITLASAGHYQEAVDCGRTFTPDDLSLESQVQYYNTMANSYYRLNDVDNYEDYFARTNGVIEQLGGQGGA